ncbi:MAG: hypothetical protein KDK97_05260 [Verrucomicrobiales bacterium]|nr:hypothetical protein [Verrucomicrobiales bacterium]MCP5558140.1 hypothetical protein [Verrucomicrobiaceae bacterium]
MVVLARDGKFGSLEALFPGEAKVWAGAYAVNVDECVAFKLQRGGLCAELVLHGEPDSTYRILRCNDIRQLAEPSTASQP